MKTTFLLTLFLVFAFIPSAKADLVDTDGDPIRNGGSYYIFPALWRHGGPVSLQAKGNETCPLTVVQAFSELAHGWPTRLSSPYRILFLPTDFIMEFIVESPPNCAATPARWTIVGGEDETKQVKLEEYEPEDTIMSTSTRGWFKIQTYHGTTYKMVYCPTDDDPCRALGLSKDEKINRPLVIADDDDDPFVVVFRKVESPAD
ncbi:trypsin inhibitor 1A-like [Prosopis cineraria]|uniref:trypsin inhibitor 1A-like n=1 Tax=Prosopis cineraria TaxID=364024 RepID=UPI00240FB96C|nr:trypsin inhibitor 1A-like [Prosopis cineraria]